MEAAAYAKMAATESTHWWFVARREILDAVIRSLGLPDSARILEAGSGTGGNLTMLGTHGQVSGIDMDQDACRMAHAKTEGRFRIVQGHFPDDIPLQSERFDLVCMFDALEHVDRDIETLAALRERLAPGGRMLVTVPAYPCLWGPHDVFLHHKRRYTRRALEQTCTRAGLRIDRLTYFNTLLLPLAVAGRLKDKALDSSQPSGTRQPSVWLNRILLAIFRLEKPLLRRFNLPAGVSLLTILSRTEANAAGS